MDDGLDGTDRDEFDDVEPDQADLVEAIDDEPLDDAVIGDAVIGDAVIGDDAIDDEAIDDDGSASDVEGTQSKVTKVRTDGADASPFDRGGEANGRIAMVVAGIVALAVVAAFFITRSAENTDLKLVDGSVQESLTADCFWSIAFELENTTDNPVAVFDAKVFTGRGDLIVTQAARDMVVEANSTAQNAITYYVDNCPSDPTVIEHGSLDILNASLGGAQQTTRLEF